MNATLVVQVSLPDRTRPVSCRALSREHEIGDRVLVDLDGRTHFATVTRVPLPLPWRREARLGRVLRPASRSDEEHESHRQRRAEDALRVAQEKADELGLEMRFVRAEPAGTGRKIVLSFTADGRVDFRELVRRLARALRSRVELRQVGVRDAAMTRGGFGHCGRPLCCSTFLPGFAPVSMKMAKQQGLPLNPSKISGQCGRLMCCLRYEVEGSGRTPCCGGGAGRGEDAPSSESERRRRRRGTGRR
jgi:hypothetical protein